LGKFDVFLASREGGEGLICFFGLFAREGVALGNFGIQGPFGFGRGFEQFLPLGIFLEPQAKSSRETERGSRIFFMPLWNLR
jgi:hypothetical protein